METLTLTTPISTTTARVGAVYFQKEPTPEIVLTLLNNMNEPIIVRASATMLPADILIDLKALNKANLTVKSLDKRLIEWAQARQAALAGAVSGVPD